MVQHSPPRVVVMAWLISNRFGKRQFMGDMVRRAEQPFTFLAFNLDLVFYIQSPDHLIKDVSELY